MYSGAALRPGAVVAAILLLAPMLIAAFSPDSVDRLGRDLPRVLRIASPTHKNKPNALTAKAFGIFYWGWAAVYALLPVTVAFLLDRAKTEDAARRGNWRDYVVLIALGLAVFLLWLETAWPPGLSALG